MNLAKMVTVLGALAMGMVLINGFSAGTLAADGAILTSLRWVLSV